MQASGIYDNILIDDYHAMPGLSSTGVSLMLDCPKRYWHAYINPDRQKLDTKALRMGQAVHQMALEPDLFVKNFLILPEEIDLRTKVGKAAYEEALQIANGRTVLKKSEADEIVSIVKVIKGHSLWSKIGHGLVENTLLWDLPPFGIRLKSRPDFYNDKVIVDLKTTNSIKTFQRSMWNMGYYRQAAMQIDGLRALTGETRHFAFFVVEKTAPYLTACFTLDEDSLEQGRREVKRAAELYQECMTNNDWPGYAETFQLLKLPAFAIENDEEEFF